VNSEMMRGVKYTLDNFLAKLGSQNEPIVIPIIRLNDTECYTEEEDENHDV